MLPHTPREIPGERTNPAGRGRGGGGRGTESTDLRGQQVGASMLHPPPCTRACFQDSLLDPRFPEGSAFLRALGLQGDITPAIELLGRAELAACPAVN